MSSQQPENDFMKPVSSRSLTSASTSTAAKQNSESRTRDNNSSLTPLTSSPKPSTFMDAKQARESSKPSRAGGGIFRPSGDHTIFDKGEKQSSADRAATKPSSPPAAAMNGTSQKTNSSSSIKPPMTLFNFTRSWESLDLAEDKWRLISQIPPTSLPAFFQTSLDPSLLVSILDTFLAVLHNITDPEDDNRARMRQYMAMFSKVPRFSTVVLLMSKKEKEKAKEVWDKMGVRNGGAAWGMS
ncbi:hypothetical protein PILCRDRAFT_591682 [Piloderma croceum F 1598]|uniref:RNA-polymerase II-associated protein 3-like C-terminal domain-containing protein n=1 Tax=Piloderma croceum (strain F 1598) TaxID=765440 RepID=A0A0C3F155_PILCF|nr:hypothetical protein PILCRDRAFT_591682 [Piloderma croceum F 1598]